MIDIENEVFTKVKTAVLNAYPDTYVTGVYARVPPSFPCVSVEEKSNRIFERTQSSDSPENHVLVMYEVNVYSNKQNGKKTECKEIIAVIDKVFIEMGFDRTMLNPIPNLEDATIYRMTGRYQAVVDANMTIYRK